MAQHDFNIANQTFPATRIDLNNAWAAIVSNSSGATAPSTTYAYQFWYDTNTDTLKIRNTDNDAWISLFVLNQTTDTITSVDGRDIAVDGSKLDGIEVGATADQTAAEIRALVEAASDSNVFTDADHTKLNGIETAATADQTASEILTAIKTVDGAASGLDADLLDGQQGSYYTGYTDTAVSNLVDSSPAALNTLNELAAALGDDANFSTTVTNSIATKLPLAGGTMTGNISFAAGQSFDGRDVSADGSKLDGIEAGATADQTGAEIKTAYEAEANAFTDAQFTKLAGIETSATADQTDAEIRAAVEAATDSNVFTDADHTKLNGIATGATAYGDSDVDTHLNTSTASASEVLSWTGSDYDWVAQSGGGGGDPDLYRDNAVSATTPVPTGNNAVSIGSGSTTNGNQAFALGTTAAASATAAYAIGYLAQAVAGATFSAAIGYNARTRAQNATAFTNSSAGGQDSIAGAIATNSPSYGALGANSVAMGYQAKATNSNSVAIGDRAVASGSMSFAVNRSTASGANGISIGLLSEASGRNSVAIGNAYDVLGPKATVYNSIAIGKGSLSDKEGKIAISGNQFAAAGDGQHGIFVLRIATTNATATVLTTGPDDLASATADDLNQVVLPNNSAFAFHGTIIAREDATDGSDYASWEIKGALLRDANAASTVLGNGIQNKLYATAGASAWAIALTADTTNGGLKIEVTGAAATNIRWVATVNTSEVTYA